MARYLARPREEYAFAFAPTARTAPSASSTQGPNQSNTSPESGARRHVAAAFGRAQATAVRDALTSAAKIPLAALDVDIAAIANALATAHPDSRAGGAVVLQAERHATTALRLQGGAPAGFAIMRETAGEGADAQERAEALLKRAHAIRDGLRPAAPAWQTQERANLSGELAATEDFRELLRAQTGIAFRLLNPFANLPGPDPADFPGAWPGAPYAAAVGLALRLVEEP
jgi:hypothetical protein